MNKTVIGIIAGVILLGAVAYSAKPALFGGGACSVKSKASCQTECSGKSCEAKKAEVKEKKDACCASK